MKKLITIMTVAGACFLASCGGKSGSAGNSSDSTAAFLEKNEKTAWRAEMAFANRDVETVYKDCAPDFTEYESGESKPLKNIDSVKAAVKGLFAAFPDMTGKDLMMMGKGDTVIILGTWTGTFKGAMGPMKPTGKSFRIYDGDIYSFNKEGKITSHKSIQSMNSYISQVAGTMAPGK